MKKNVTLMVVGTVALSAAVAALFATLSPSTGGVSIFGRNLAAANGTDVDADVDTKFNKFISKHHRSFITREEYNARRDAFKINYDIVKAHNATKHGYTVGLN